MKVASLGTNTELSVGIVIKPLVVSRGLLQGLYNIHIGENLVVCSIEFNNIVSIEEFI